MKTLIIYTTKYGSVAKCAGLLRDRLAGGADIVNLAQNALPALADYDTVVLGGSIYVGRVQKKLSRFAEDHRDELLKKRLGLFICAGEPSDKKYTYLQKNFPRALCEHALCRDVFGDELYFEKLNPVEKLAVRSLKGISAGYSHLAIDRIDAMAAALNG